MLKCLFISDSMHNTKRENTRVVMMICLLHIRKHNRKHQSYSAEMFVYFRSPCSIQRYFSGTVLVCLFHILIDNTKIDNIIAAVLICLFQILLHNTKIENIRVTVLVCLFQSPIVYTKIENSRHTVMICLFQIIY